MLVPTFLEKKFLGGGVEKKIVVLASEHVGGRSRATELPCLYIYFKLTGTTIIKTI